jgi:hypothetical protein
MIHMSYTITWLLWQSLTKEQSTWTGALYRPDTICNSEIFTELQSMSSKIVFIPSSNWPLRALSSTLPQFLIIEGLALFSWHTYCRDSTHKALGMNFLHFHPSVSSSSDHPLIFFVFCLSSSSQMRNANFIQNGMACRSLC